MDVRLEDCWHSKFDEKNQVLCIELVGIFDEDAVYQMALEIVESPAIGCLLEVAPNLERISVSLSGVKCLANRLGGVVLEKPIAVYVSSELSFGNTRMLAGLSGLDCAHFTTLTRHYSGCYLRARTRKGAKNLVREH